MKLILRKRPAASKSFYDFDLTGNTTAITNSVGLTVNTYSYLPFGEKLSLPGQPAIYLLIAGHRGAPDLGDGFYQATYRTYLPLAGPFHPARSFWASVGVTRTSTDTLPTSATIAARSDRRGD